uniref:Cell division cycle protein 27 homolog n=1 Tax=Macrostomum lignano TaxID=282301 RepID=A0A1I8HK75_9PLAT
MAPCGIFFTDNGTMESLIWKNLNFFCYDNALFLAEHLYAQDKTESSAYILATCFHRCNRPNQAKKLLQCSALTQPLTMYLYAQCCLETGDLSAAEDALINSRTGLAFATTQPQAQQTPIQTGLNANDDLSRLCRDFGGDNSEDSTAVGFALKLLGDVYRRTDRNERAADCYRRALGFNPYLWTCYEALCSLGEAPDPAVAFPVQTATAGLDTSSASSLSADCGGLGGDASSVGIANNNSNSTRQFSVESAASTDASVSGAGFATVSVASATAASAAAATPAVSGVIPAPPAIADAPMRRRPRSGRQQQQQQQIAPGADSAVNFPYILDSAYSTPLPSSMAASTAAAIAAVAATPAASAVATATVLPVSTPVAQNYRALAMSPLGAKENNQGVRTRAQTRSLMSSRAGNISRRSRSFRSKDNSSMEDEWLSRAYYELEDYHGACRLFSELRQRQPWNLRGMDVYSSTLWYLQKEAQLSSLARDLLDLDRCAAVEPWCAAGNCFSLQREHEIALKYFRRATQVNPNYAYAYVLLALEYTSIDQLEKALAAFRTAVRLEPRAYNAWYGISNVYFKQEKFALAECHFIKALRIYPNSAVLLTNFGVTMARMGRLSEALDLFTKAKSLSPKMPLCRYQRASVLFTLGRHQDALQELNSLRQLTPKESRVFFLLGRVYKALDQLNDTLDIVAGGGGGGGTDAGASESDTTMDVSMQPPQQQQHPGYHMVAPSAMMMDEILSDQSSVD